MWHCACTWLGARVFTWETVCTAPVAALFFFLSFQWLLPNARRTSLCVEGLVNMNYSQSGLHIPHGHCLWLKLEVLSPLSTSPVYLDGVCCKKNSVGGISCFPQWLPIRFWWFAKKKRLIIKPDYTVHLWGLIFNEPLSDFPPWAIGHDANEPHFSTTDPKSITSSSPGPRFKMLPGFWCREKRQSQFRGECKCEGTDQACINYWQVPKVGDVSANSFVNW